MEDTIPGKASVAKRKYADVAQDYRTTLFVDRDSFQSGLDERLRAKASSSGMGTKLCGKTPLSRGQSRFSHGESDLSEDENRNDLINSGGDRRFVEKDDNMSDILSISRYLRRLKKQESQSVAELCVELERLSAIAYAELDDLALATTRAQQLCEQLVHWPESYHLLVPMEETEVDAYAKLKDTAMRTEGRKLFLRNTKELGESSGYEMRRGQQRPKRSTSIQEETLKRVSRIMREKHRCDVTDVKA
ncbi:hypothetical protein COOONC_00973 [Cooperia oncophora]